MGRIKVNRFRSKETVTIISKIILRLLLNTLV